MTRSSKLSHSSLGLLFRISIVIIFLFGLLPVPALAQGNGTIAGRVTDNATGNPIDGASIGVLETYDAPPSWPGNTDASGNYTVSVPQGTGYTVVASKAGYVRGEVTNQSVTANVTTTVNFSLLPGGVIQGTVTDNYTGNPIQGASVWAYKPEAPETTYHAMPTDAGGNYALTAPLGTGYTVKAAKNDYVDAIQTGIDAELGSPKTVNLALNPTGPPPDTTPPAAVTLAAGSPTPNSITLTWSAPGDDGDTDTASLYDIRWASAAIDDGTKWADATPVSGEPPPKAAGQSESFTVGGLSDNTTYFFALVVEDEVPNLSGLSNSPSATTIPRPYFNIAHHDGMHSFMRAAGTGGQEVFNISSVNNFAGTVNLAFHGPPGLEDPSSLSTSNITLAAGERAQVTLALAASAQMPSGTYDCAVAGQTTAYGGQQKERFLTVTVGAEGQPLLSASPSVVAQGGQITFSVSQFLPSENITLRWDSGLNAGQQLGTTGTIDQDGNWSLTLDVPGNAPAGNFVVKAISASRTATVNFTVTSGVGADFIISSSPQFISIAPGNQGNVTIYVTSVNSFNAPVSLSAGSPPEITCSFNPGSVTPPANGNASATLTIAVQEWANPGMHHIMVDVASANPPITKCVDVTLDIPAPAEWGPSIALSKTYGSAGDTITITGSNFPLACDNQTAVIRGDFTPDALQTMPATITVTSGGFTGTFTIPPEIPSGNYRIEARVPTTNDFAEADFQIMGTGATFSLEASPRSITVLTEEGKNSASTSVSLFSISGRTPSVNLDVEGAPSWLEYRFGTLPANTPASGENAVSVPAGGSIGRSLTLTASMTAPTGTYSVTVKGWETGQTPQHVSLELTVQPPADFNMEQFTLSPTFGSPGQNVNFSGSGFTGCDPGQVTSLTFGPADILSGLPTISVPQDGDSVGRFSGSFYVPGLPPGTYRVEVRVGEADSDTFAARPFTISGTNDTFVLQASPTSMWTEQGNPASTMIQARAVGSSSPTVKLAVEGRPSDISASFESSTVAPPPGGIAGTNLTFTTNSWTPTGHYNITVRGWRDTNSNDAVDAGEEVHRANLEIDISPPAGFGMASIYISPTSGSAGTWVTVSGSGFPGDTQMSHFYLGSPCTENDRISQLPTVTTDNTGALSVVLQIPTTLPAGTYPIEVVVGDPPGPVANFSVVSADATFSIDLSPSMIHATPDLGVSTSVNIQSVGSSSANITLQVEGPSDIKWRFDEGDWNTTTTVSPAIGSTMVSNLEVRAEPYVPMGPYWLILKATAGEEQQVRELKVEVGAADGYSMPIFSLSPNSGTVGSAVSFSGSNFSLANTPISSITFGGEAISLAQAITTSPQGAFSGQFTVPSTVGEQPTAPGSYIINVTVGAEQAGTRFDVYGSDNTFTISLSPSYLQGEPGIAPVTSGFLMALGSAAPTVKMAVRGLPPGVATKWNGAAQSVFTLSVPPGGQNSFELSLELPSMIAMGQYPAVLLGWVDSVSQNNAWDEGEESARVNLELSVMPPQGYGMGMFTLSPNFGQVGDTITFAGSGFPANTAVQSLRFAETNVLTQAITTSNTGSFSGMFTVPATAFGGEPTGPGMYPVDVRVGDHGGHFEFQVVASSQKFSVGASPGWMARPAGDTAYVNLVVRSLVVAPPSPTVIVQIEGLPYGVTPSFTTCNVTPPVSDMESRELRLTISGSCPPGNYRVSVKAYNAASPTEEMWTDFTLEVTPSSGFMDMGMAMVTISPTFGSTGSSVTVSGYGFPKNQNLTHIWFGAADVTPSVATSTDDAGAFSAVITVPPLDAGPHPVEVNVNGTIRDTKFDIMGANATFSLKVSPMWLEPLPAGDPNGRAISITVDALPGKTPTVNLRTEGLFTAFGSINEVWVPASGSVNVTMAGGAASAVLTLKPTENVPPGPYPFTIAGLDTAQNRCEVHMELMVGPPLGFMDSMMGMNQTAWSTEWQGTEWESGIFFPDVTLSPCSGLAGTQVTYTGTNLPANASVTSVTFAGNTVPLPADGLTADSAGGFSGSFIVNDNWNLAPGGTYFADFDMENGDWSQIIVSDFYLMKSGTQFSFDVTPDWMPPKPPGDYGQTKVNVKAVGYQSPTVMLGVEETFGGGSLPGGAEAHWGAVDGPDRTSVTVSSGGQSSANLYIKGTDFGRYTITIIGWIDSDDDQELDSDIPSEADSVFTLPLDFEVQLPQEFMNWDKDFMMTQMGMHNDDMYLFYFPEITLNPNMGKAGTKVSITATDFPAEANVTHLRFAGMELPVPTGTATDANGGFSLVFNVPKTMWNSNIGSGRYDVEVEAQKPGKPPVHMMKPFQVTAADVAFTLRAEPDWLPPLPPEGSQTTIWVKSTGAAANVTLSVDRIPPGVNTAFSPSQVTVPPGGSSSATLTLTPTHIPPGRYGAEIKGTATIDGTPKEFWTHIEFEVKPPMEFMNWDKDAMMSRMNMHNDDMYLFYFPEITLNPNMGKAGTKVTITATDFPTGANVTRLRFASTELPVPTGTTTDNVTGGFTLVFNVPKTMWSDNISSGRYDVEVQAQKPGEPPVHMMNPFQVTASDVAFTLRAEPDWLPPIPPEGSQTTIRLNSMGAGVTVNLTVDAIPPGITASFSSAQINVPPGGSISTTLTLIPGHIPPGHYGAEIKGTATIDGAPKEFYTHLEFEVKPPMGFMNIDWMAQQGVWFPEITLNPNSGQAQTKVTVKATDFPTGANVTRLRFAGMELPIPAGTAADNVTGGFTLVFNIPSDFGVGFYMVEVEAEKTGMPPVFIAKPFSVAGAEVSFNLKVVPGFIPGVPQGDSDETTIFVEATGQAVTVDLHVDGLPPGVIGTFSSSQLSVPPGGSSSTTLTITTTASTPPGHYPLSIRGTSGDKERVMPFGFGVMPPAIFQMPEFRLEPDFAPAGYGDKKFKVTFSGTGFPKNQSVASVEFGAQTVAIPQGLTTDNIRGSFNGVFLVPTGLEPGTYDVMVAVETGTGDYVYDSRPFTIKGSDTTFILNPSPPYLPPILQGSQGRTTINVRSVGTSTANVTLYVDGLTPGITAEFSPSNVVTVSPGSSGIATVTLSVATRTPSGPYPLNIRGVSGTETVAVPLGFGVMPNIGGGQGYATITVNPPRGRPGENIGISGAGFTADATITLEAAPPGAPIAINITPGTLTVQSDGTWATQITVPPAGQVPPGFYVIKAMDGTRAAKRPFDIVPTANADFFLNVSPPFLEIVQGQTGETTFSISSRNGFMEAVTFSVGGLAPGVITTFQDAAGNTVGKFSGTPGGIKVVTTPTPLTPRPGEDLMVTILIEVDSGAPIGPYDIALRAETAAICRVTPLGLLVSPPGASMVVSPMGGPADTDISLSGSGFTAGETVTVAFAGTSITTVPATITVADDGTFTAVITAPAITAGIHPVTATDATSGIVMNRPFGLKPSAVNTFVLYASPGQLNIPKGDSGEIITKVEPLSSFGSAVTLSVSGLGAITGATSAFTPAATITPSIGTPTTATLTINVPAGASEGRYPLVISGTSGAITQTRNITVNVVPPADTPDFAISLAPNTLPINPDSSGETTVTVTSLNEFTGTVSLAVTMSDPAAPWPTEISYNTNDVTPSATTGLGKQTVTFTVSAGTQPGNWSFKITGTSGALEHSAEVMVICTPSGTVVTTYPSPRLDPATITSSTPMDMEPPWGDKIQINGLINDGSEASIITPSKMEVPPDTLGSLPEGASDMLGRITNIDSSIPVDGVEWNLGLPYDSDTLAAAGLEEENLKVAYLNPDTGTWTEVTTVIDTDNKVAYASLDHFSSWTLIGTPAPPPSVIITGGGAPVSVKRVQTSGLSGTPLHVTSTGLVQSTCWLRTEDSQASLKVPAQTRILDADGKASTSLTAAEVTSLPVSPPLGAIVSAYDFGPDGSTFSPAITLSMIYDPSALPEGATEDELYIAYWDGSRWVNLESTVNAQTNTITAQVEHFTQFAVLAKLPPPPAAVFDISVLAIAPIVVKPLEAVTVSVVITNIGAIEGTQAVALKINGVERDRQEVTLDAGATQEVSFTVTENIAETYAVDVNGLVGSFTVEGAAAESTAAPEPTPPAAPPAAPGPTPETVLAPPAEPAPTPAPTQPAVPINWWLIGGIIAGIAVIATLVWQLVTHRKAS